MSEVDRELPEIEGMQIGPYLNEEGIAQPNIYRIEDSSEIDGWRRKIIPREGIVDLGRRLRSQSQKIVFVSGTYDMIHVGHARYLTVGRALGTSLVVGINDDSSVRAYKGEDRPILTETVRGEMLAHLMAVSYVAIFKEKFPDDVIRELRPHRVLCIEENWENRLHTRSDATTAFEVGAEVFVSPRQDPILSTSTIISKLMKDGQRDLIRKLGKELNDPDALVGSLGS
jgi:rfaE bifunctional protein nucleotidyltransferase chain/domain